MSIETTDWERTMPRASTTPPLTLREMFLALYGKLAAMMPDKDLSLPPGFVGMATPVLRILCRFNHLDPKAVTAHLPAVEQYGLGTTLAKHVMAQQLGELTDAQYVEFATALCRFADLCRPLLPEAAGVGARGQLRTDGHREDDARGGALP